MTKDQISRTHISIYLKDFRQSREFSEYILQRRLPGKKGPKVRLIHLAFNTSLIVSYARPFTANKNAEGRTERSPLKERVGEVLNEVEQKAHAKIVQRRNSTYAHSDAGMYLIRGSDYKSHSVHLMADPFCALLTESETAMVHVIIGKWIKHLLHERARLKAVQN